MKQKVILLGGLGNQMFQYAFALALDRNGHNVCLDISSYLSTHQHNGFELNKAFTLSNSRLKFTKSRLCDWFLRLLVKYPSFFRYFLFKEPLCLSFSSDALISKCNYLYGFFQSEKYFKDVSSEIKESFQFRNIDIINQNIAAEISSLNSVSIHVRRGDYVQYGMPLMSKEYYMLAVSFIKEYVHSPFFVIFSDDIPVALEIVEECGIKYKIIDINTGSDSYKDMFLMSKCKHNIIANSSFSWWGAWLNDNPTKIVVAPEWGRDFSCESWHVIKI